MKLKNHIDRIKSKSNHRRRFPLPLPPTTTITITSTATSAASISSSDLEKLQVLGHGNGGTVYKVRHKCTNAIYVLKVVHSDSDPTLHRQVFREMEILHRTDSPHVVRCHGIFEKPSGDISMLMKYMNLGTLDSLLRTQGSFFEPKLVDVALQVLNGLSYLHEHKIIHRNLKPSNLLVNDKMEVKIADFSVSKIMCHTLDACNFGEPSSLPEQASEEFRSFIECCLRKESDKRWIVAQLLTHPFVCKDPR